MSKQSLLLVDGDTRSLRVLEVSLRKAGFTVTPASSVADALDKLELHTPDLIISETKFPTDLDGFELRRRVRGVPDWAEIPFVFLTAETAIEHKIRGLELGVDDYLTKPIYIKEIVTRINILLQKRQRAYFDERKDGVRFAGRVADMPVVDVIQTIEVSRKSGVIQFSADRQRTAAIYFRDGKVIDAEAGTLQGEDAVYRLLTWSEGEFEVVFRTVRRREVIATSSQGLLMEGMRRLDEWSRLLEQLPPLSHRFEIDTAELATRLGEVPDDNNPILRLIDGKRSLLEVIDASDFGDLECLQAIARLYFEGLLIDLDPQERPKRDTGKPMPLVMLPMEEVASGPIARELAESTQEPDSMPAKREPNGGTVAKVIAMSEKASKSAEQASSTSMAPPENVGARPGASVEQADASASPMAVPENVDAKRVSSAAEQAGAKRASSAAEQASANPSPSEENVGAKPWSSAAEAASAKPSPSEENVGAKPWAPASASANPEAASMPPVAPSAAPPEPATLRSVAGTSAGTSATDRAATDAATAPTGTGRPEPVAIAAIADDEVELPRRDSGEAIGDSDVVSEEEDLPGPLTGGYRPSSLRLIDEAVAAAQAIDPSLFESDLVATPEPPATLARVQLQPRGSDARIANARGVVELNSFVSADHGANGQDTVSNRAKTRSRPPPVPMAAIERAIARAEASDAEIVLPADEDYSGVPTVIEAETDLPPAEHEPYPDEVPTSPIRPPFVPRREDSAMRMIGSLGRDRAEASGAIEQPRLSSERASTEPQRELVTIMPRRITRDIPILPAVVAESAEHDDSVSPIDPPTLPPPPPRISIAGGVRRATGPGPIAMVLVVIASVMAGIAIYLYLHKRLKHPAVARTGDAAEQVVVADAELVEPAPDAAIVVAVTPDAGVRASRRDAGAVASAPADAAVRIATADAGARVAQAADAGAAADPAQRLKDARALRDQAHAALEDGDPDKALKLADQSLALHKTALAYIDRARAQQRLGQVDDALKSIDSALELVIDYAPAWEQRGMILWAARRRDEARPALERYLELDPHGKDADSIRQMLNNTP